MNRVILERRDNMYVTCNDLLTLDSFSNCKVLTGDTGLNRIISWPYMARVLLDENLFHGGEFIIIAESYVKYDEETLLSFLDICHSQYISGLLIFIDYESDGLNSVPASVIAKGIEKNIPIFELPWNIRSIDVLKEISVLILKNSQKNDALLHCMKHIIFYDNAINSDRFKQLINLGYSDNPYHLIRIQLFHFDKYCDEKNIESELKRHEQMIFLWHLISHTLNEYFPNSLILTHAEILVCILDKTKYPDISLISENLSIFYSNVLNLLSTLDVRVCLSKSYNSIYHINAAFHDTTHIMELSNLEEFQGLPIIYDKVGVYKILLASKKSNLKMIYDSVMNPLIDFDSKNDSNLIETLSIYLHSNNSLEETSKQLFMHSNTIRYRLKKIESLTDMSLKSTDDLAMFCYCIHIKNFLRL